MTFGVVVFPGSNCDKDCAHVIEEVLGQSCVFLWHKDTKISHIDAIILPGGFSYGDYLRSGAIASHSNIMKAVLDFSLKGGLVLGICNGFQILLESFLLDGALQKNDHQKFICKTVELKVLRTDTPFTNQFDSDAIIRVPIAHAEGKYYPDESKKKFLGDNVLFSYHNENPNGSFENIAGLTNERKNVLGMMPHPERCSEPYPIGDDGLKIFKSMLNYLQKS